MKVIRGKGERGPVRVKAKRLEDAKKATLVERTINSAIRENVLHRLMFGEGDRLDSAGPVKRSRWWESR